MKNTGTPGGHRSQKSSPYCVTDCKLITQHLVYDRMNSHRKRLLKAKASIDTSPPKSLFISQKSRDQLRRQAPQKSGKTPRYNGIEGEIDDADTKSESDADRDEIYAMLESLNDEGDDKTFDFNHNITAFQSDVLDRKFLGDTNIHFYKPKEVTENKMNRSVSYANFHTIHKFKTGAMASPRVSKSADIVDIHAHHFTEGKDFHPRTLRSNQSSRLGTFKYYNPPKRKPTTKADSKSTKPAKPFTNSQVELVKMHQLKNSNGHRMMSDTIISRSSSLKVTPTGVPPLEISLDPDHANWLKEQSKKTYIGDDATYTSRIAELKKDILNPPKTIITNFRNEKTTTKYRIKAEEEELKYLAFIEDVTAEIIDRGLYTDRVLKQIFESHMDKNKDSLDRKRMEEMLLQLQEDLGMSKMNGGSSSPIPKMSNNITAEKEPHFQSNDHQDILDTLSLNKTCKNNQLFTKNLNFVQNSIEEVPEEDLNSFSNDSIIDDDNELDLINNSNDRNNEDTKYSNPEDDNYSNCSVTSKERNSMIEDLRKVLSDTLQIEPAEDTDLDNSHNKTEILLEDDLDFEHGEDYDSDINNVYDVNKKEGDYLSDHF